MNRYIPKKISDAVKKRHYFQCAWCCINLTDRHHIVEYSDWWKHSEENLILLCQIVIGKYMIEKFPIRN
jgi:hypothetical protein